MSLVLAWVTKLAMDDNIEKVSGPMLVKLLEERQTLAVYFYDGSMSNDVRYDDRYCKDSWLTTNKAGVFLKGKNVHLLDWYRRLQ